MLFVFIIFSLLNLISVSFDIYWLELISKPVIIPSLLAFFIDSTKRIQSPIKTKLLVALILSFAGDVLLLFASLNTLFFILGLASFLIAHLFYILAFTKFISFSKVKFHFGKIALITIVIYIGIFFMVLLPKVDRLLLLPIICYGVTIGSMLFISTGLKQVFKSSTYKYLLIGAVLFVISDSLIAISKFVIAFPLSHLTIMLTYIVAQYLIIQSCNTELLRMKLDSESKT